MGAGGASGRGGDLAAVRARIDAIDARLLALLDERSELAASVASAKRVEAGAADPPFGLRPDREAAVLRRLLRERRAASPALIVRLWREVMADSLSRQGPFRLTVWGGRAPERAVELARLRFGTAPSMRLADAPEAAIAAAREPGGVAVLALEGGAAWWGRLLAEPKLKVFAALPCLNAWGPPAALAIADVPVEPTGLDETFWVTDAPRLAGAIVQSLSELGLAAELRAEGGGLRLFSLAGYVQPDDERLARAPGRLTGVIGAAPQPFDA